METIVTEIIVMTSIPPNDPSYYKSIDKIVAEEYPHENEAVFSARCFDMHRYYHYWITYQNDVREATNYAATCIHQLKATLEQSLPDGHARPYSDDVLETVAIIDSCIENIRSTVHQGNDFSDFESALRRELRQLNRDDELYRRSL